MIIDIYESLLIRCFSNPKNIGYFLLDNFYDSLGVYDVLNNRKSSKQIDYDLNGNAKLLIFGRLLNPDSKLGTFKDKDRYLCGVTKSENVKDIYYTLDFLNEKSDSIQRRMNLKISQNIGRNTEVCFYDVTNYYFEIGENDPDELNSKGEIIKSGLRKRVFLKRIEKNLLCRWVSSVLLQFFSHFLLYKTVCVQDFHKSNRLQFA